MHTVTIDYEDGTRAVWEITDDNVLGQIEQFLGSPTSMRA
jgi:hypothetical protein